MDKLEDNDLLIRSNGYNFVIDSELKNKISIINIYYGTSSSKYNFKITTDILWKEEYNYIFWMKTLEYKPL